MSHAPRRAPCHALPPLSRPPLAPPCPSPSSAAAPSPGPFARALIRLSGLRGRRVIRDEAVAPQQAEVRLSDREQVGHEPVVVPAAHEDLDLIADQREHALAPELLIVEILLHARVELVPHLRHDLLDLLRVVRLLDLEGLMEDVGHGRLHEVQVQVQDVRARVVVRQHRLLIDALEGFC